MIINVINYEVTTVN